LSCTQRRSSKSRTLWLSKSRPARTQIENSRPGRQFPASSDGAPRASHAAGSSVD
jgi:hypothetical protein